MRDLIAGLTLLTVLAAAGCAERKMTVISDPPGAVVFMDGEEMGVTPVTYKFNFYGGRRFTLKHDGYETHEEIRQISPPLHMAFPMDTIWDLTPLPARDHKTLEFKLAEQGDPDPEELRNRAEGMRLRAYEDPELGMKEAGIPPPVMPAQEVEEVAEPIEETPLIEGEPATDTPD